MFSDPRAVIIVFPLFIGVSNLIAGIKHRRKNIARHSGRVPLRRMPGKVGSRLMLGQFSFLFVLILGFVNEDLSPPSIGLSERVHFIPALTIGVLIGVIFVHLCGWLAECLGVADGLRDRSVAVIAQIIPRTNTQRILAVIAITLLNPMSEETLFRGVLIHHWDFVGQSFILAVAIGACVNLGNHIYQGLPLQLFHLSFFCVATMLLYSPVGLMGAIGVHIVGDVYPLITAKSELERYRLRHSRFRASMNV